MLHRVGPNLEQNPAAFFCSALTAPIIQAKVSSGTHLLVPALVVLSSLLFEDVLVAPDCLQLVEQAGDVGLNDLELVLLRSGKNESVLINPTRKVSQSLFLKPEVNS